MPLFGSSSAPPPLQPVPQPIGVFPFFTQHTQPMALKIREKKFSLSGDDFSVKDGISGQTIFKVDGSAFSLSSQKTISDSNGKPLYRIKKKHLHIHKTFQVESIENDSVLCTVQSALVSLMGSKMTATFANKAGAGEEIKLTVKGNHWDRKAEITTEHGVVVGRISRDFFNAGQVFADKQTYILHVAPGVDAAILLAFTIILDEAEHDEK